ncbi:hypothetical protein E1A91_D10G291000v1 [Gossypium mustelinum]|uniref:non-specific serine/threonine protein kinase n=1 Tax=Gossypium mustelinum TaxID=34275 RepID=A0A5D2TD06_GOSMU|nr:hypothetical protein E1A91_D10G291000v1 [Gossypium mustelinum]
MELSKKHFEACCSFFLVFFSQQVFSKTPTGLVVRGNDTDQQALLQFKAKITDDQLRVMESWNSSIHFCQWHGVTCGRKHQRVTKLELQSLKLSGSLSPHIGNMSFLRVLNLLNNSFYNQIPQSIGGLRRLETLYLTNNSISGEIPSNLSSCSKLTIVRMAGNRLTGEIPAFLGFLSNLKVLSFYNNSLRGSIPPSLGNLSSLEELALTYNALDGIIPETLGRLTNLSIFLAAANAISGVIPSGGIFKNASATFVEGNSKLCGGIPELHMLRCNLKTSSSNSLRLKVAIIVVTLGVTLAFTCLLILWIGKKKEKQATATSVENSVLQLSYQSIVRATDGFSTQNLVGSGSFGSVYKGVLEASGAVIAVKVLNLLNRGASRSFLAECEALKNIRHRNLVKVLTAISGVDYQGNDFKALVYEFMENGSLEDWLHPLIGMNGPETARNLNFFQRVSVAIDVAHALQYLHHHCEEPIIHCDLKPSNILLNEEMVSHISDFGLAKILSTDRLNYSANKSSSLGLRGTIGYAPPEYGMGSELSTKGDVYSYGILLLEMFTGKRPIDERFREGLSLHNFVKAALPERIIEITDPNLVQERVRRGTPNVNNFGNDWYLQCLNSLFEIGLACSAESPNERIDMSDVATKLCSVKDKLHSTRLPREVRT